MLSTGIEVLGLFVYCYDTNEKTNAYKKLNSVMNRIFAEEEDDDKTEESEFPKLRHSPHNQYILLSAFQKKVG